MVTGMKTLLASVDHKKREMLSLLKELVNIDGPSNYPEGVNQVGSILRDGLKKMGFQVSLFSGEKYGDQIYASFGTGQPSVFLMGHMDTVFSRGTVKQRPFTFDACAKKAYGPGVLDMKGGIVVSSRL